LTQESRECANGGRHFLHPGPGQCYQSCRCCSERDYYVNTERSWGVSQWKGETTALVATCQAYSYKDNKCELFIGEPHQGSGQPGGQVCNAVLYETSLYAAYWVPNEAKRSCRLKECPTAFHALNAQTGKCELCPPGTVPVGRDGNDEASACRAKTCDAWEFINGKYACEACPRLHYPKPPYKKSCVKKVCGSRSYLRPDGGCTACPDYYRASGDGTKCH